MNCGNGFTRGPLCGKLFRKRYLKELAVPEAEKDLLTLYRLAHKRKRVTLLFASKNEMNNNAVVLKESARWHARNLRLAPVLERFGQCACAMRPVRAPLDDGIGAEPFV